MLVSLYKIYLFGALHPFLRRGQVCSCTDNHPLYPIPFKLCPRLFRRSRPFVPAYLRPHPLKTRPQALSAPPLGRHAPVAFHGSTPCLPPPTLNPAPLCSAPRAPSNSFPTRKAPPNPARPRLPGRAPPGPPAPHSAARAAAWAPPAAILRRLPPPSASAPPPAPQALKAQAGTPSVPTGNTRPTPPLFL